MKNYLCKLKNNLEHLQHSHGFLFIREFHLTLVTNGNLEMLTIMKESL